VARVPFRTPDPLAEVLHLLRLSGAFYCRSELGAPWGLFMPPMEHCLWFHAVQRGRCRVELDGTPAIELGAGDFALVPHGRGHRLRSAPRVAAPNVVDLPQSVVGDRYSLLRHGGAGARTDLVCGVVRLEPPVGPALERLLPPVIRVGADALPAEWMETTLRLIARETQALRPGGETVVTRLCDVLVIHALRAWLEEDARARRGWLGALRDPAMGRTIAAVWREPERGWTVERLAAAAGMSRSAFATRFVELVGEPPMQHVTRIRMQLAQEALRSGSETAGSLASRLGYRSEAAFHRAFKRMIGSPPGAWRRDAGRADA
jgi:AraC-like DNA-binding protein